MAQQQLHRHSTYGGATPSTKGSNYHSDKQFVVQSNYVDRSEEHRAELKKRSLDELIRARIRSCTWKNRKWEFVLLIGIVILVTITTVCFFVCGGSDDFQKNQYGNNGQQPPPAPTPIAGPVTPSPPGSPTFTTSPVSTTTVTTLAPLPRPDGMPGLVIVLQPTGLGNTAVVQMAQNLATDNADAFRKALEADIKKFTNLTVVVVSGPTWTADGVSVVVYPVVTDTTSSSATSANGTSTPQATVIVDPAVIAAAFKKIRDAQTAAASPTTNQQWLSNTRIEMNKAAPSGTSVSGVGISKTVDIAPVVPPTPPPPICFIDGNCGASYAVMAAGGLIFIMLVVLLVRMIHYKATEEPKELVEPARKNVALQEVFVNVPVMQPDAGPDNPYLSRMGDGSGGGGDVQLVQQQQQQNTTTSYTSPSATASSNNDFELEAL